MSYPTASQSRRYMTSQECVKLQGMDDHEHLLESERTAFIAIGDAVDVDVVEISAETTFETDQDSSLVAGAIHAVIVQEANVV